MVGTPKRPAHRVDYGFFYKQVEAGNIEKADVIGNGFRIAGEFRTPPAKPDKPAEYYKKKFVVDTPPWLDVKKELHDLLKKQTTVFTAEELTDSAYQYMMLYLLVTLLLFGGVWMMWRRTRDQMFGGGGFLSGFAKSPGQALRRRPRSGSRSTTWPGWKA